MAKTTKLSITVTKTFQFNKFEPSVVSVTEECAITEDDDKQSVAKKMYKRVSDIVEECLMKEGKRYKDTKGEG